MKLTSRSEYALLALIYLGRHQGESFHKIETIAQEQGIPAKFLEQIMLALKRARFVTSIKGQHGGYKLAQRPADIKLADVIRLFDGALAPTESVSLYYYEHTPIEKEAKLVAVFRDIRDYVAAKLEGTRLADVI
jgi:Rrf2 family cysteine metabolism transcriptional repressor